MIIGSQEIRNPMDGTALEIIVKISRIWRVRAWFAVKVFKLAGLILGIDYTEIQFDFGSDDSNEDR